MSARIDQIAELQSLEGGLPRRRTPRWLRRFLRRMRMAWILLTGFTTVLLIIWASLVPAADRSLYLFMASFALLACFFLVREARGFRAGLSRERFLWFRLRDLSQIWEVILGIRSEEEVRLLGGIGLKEVMLLLRSRLGAVYLHDNGGDDHITALGMENEVSDHRPWLLELENLLKGLKLNTPVFVPNIDEDSHFVDAELLRQAGFRSFAAMRLGWNDRVLGTMILGNPHPTEFRLGDDKTLELSGRQIARAILFGKELDQLKDRIEQLKRENDELTYSSQLKSEFAAVASHELKTPLTAIKASADTLLGNVRERDYENLEEFLAVIREEADRLIGLTGKILEISSLDYSNQAMDRRPIALRRVAQSCAQVLEVHIQEKDMHLQLGVPKDLPPVFADPDMIRQVLINLISNAIKFSKSGQTITVRAEVVEKNVRLQVIDLGLGIPQEEQPHIFERFYQGSRQGDYHVESTGLGLAIVKQIVEQHSGSIKVESEPGRGTCFTITLPLAPDTFGLRGSMLDIQPAGEVEEFLRLSVDWITHIASPKTSSFYLAKNDELLPLPNGGSEQDQSASQGIAVSAFSLGEACISGDHNGGETSYIALPLVFKEQVVGTFVVGREKPSYRQEDLLLLEGVVERIARVLEHAAGEEDPGRELRRVMRAVRDLVSSSSRRLPNRVDPGILAYELALRAGVPKELARDVRLATNFHDVAMAQIGVGIEREMRPLSVEEKEKLRDHPRQAAALLEDIQAMEDVSKIVLHHHEWYDGSGYPAELAGEDIPLGARMVAIIDAFSSMILWRKYKPVLTPLEAVEELIQCSGSQFDPTLVSHFTNLLKDKEWIEGEAADEMLRLHERLELERSKQSGIRPSPAASDETVEESLL